MASVWFLQFRKKSLHFPRFDADFSTFLAEPYSSRLTILENSLFASHCKSECDAKIVGPQPRGSIRLAPRLSQELHLFASKLECDNT